MWRNHTREWYILIFVPFAIWVCLFSAAIVCIVMLPQYPIRFCSDVNKTDTQITFTYNNKYETNAPDEWCNNWTLVCNKLYSIPNTAEVHQLTFNKTYTCLVTKNRNDLFQLSFNFNESLSDCVEAELVS